MLSRINKRTSQKESVRLEPHPPYIVPSALEARHWGATYALYRVSTCRYVTRALTDDLVFGQFCNGIQLNRVLPPGPREYWNELAAEQKGIPEHQKWMYDADPFAARKAVEERQAKAVQRREDSARGNAVEQKPQLSKEFENAPEAKMASALRDVVESAIKQVTMVLYCT